MQKKLFYSDKGQLGGKTPSGKFIIIRHLQHGQSKFEIIWDSEKLNWSYAERVWEELGIPVKQKQSGKQRGSPQEAVLRAVWRYFVNLYNEHSPNVELF